MGREATITREQVHAVADSIKAQNGKPTLRAVRERLGSGSMGTVAKYLSEWRNGQELQSAANMTLPPLVQRSLIEFIQAELSAARGPLQDEIAEHQQMSSDLASENERQTEVIDSQAQELAELAAEKAVIEGKATQLIADLDAEREAVMRERQAAEEARTELAKALLRLEAMPKLESELSNARAELADARTGRIQSEQNAAVLASQKSDLEARLDDAKREAEKASGLLQRSLERTEQLSSDLSDARLNVQGQKNRLEVLEEQLKKAQDRSDKLSADLAAANSLVKSLEAQQSEQEAQIEALKANLQSSHPPKVSPKPRAKKPASNQIAAGAEKVKK